VTNEQKKALCDAILSTLSRTIDFLRFAETKNAALLTFTSAWLLALANLLASDRIPNHVARTAIAVSLLLFAAAAVVALLSFLPRLKLKRFQRDPDRQKSLLYFGDISELEATTYSTRFSERYWSETEQLISDAYLKDLAVQVAANSSIAHRKFNIFNIGTTLVVIALVVLTATGAWMTYYDHWIR
jgi:hypothetical protein